MENIRGFKKYILKATKLYILLSILEEIKKLFIIF